MNIKASELKTFLSKYRQDMERGDKWIYALPIDISAAFFDNKYIDSLYARESLSMQMLFGDLYEDISWFLYEWKPEHGEITMSDGTKYNIQNLDDYMAYLVSEHLVENDALI